MPLSPQTQQNIVAVDIEQDEPNLLSDQVSPSLNLWGHFMQVVKGTTLLVGTSLAGYLAFSRWYVTSDEKPKAGQNHDSVTLADEPDILLTLGAKQLLDYPAADAFIPLETIAAQNQQDIEPLDIHYRDDTFQPNRKKNAESLSNTFQNNASRAYRPIGPEFKFDNSTLYNNKIAMLQDGGFVAVSADTAGIYSQRYRANGTAVGPGYQINTHYFGGLYGKLRIAPLLDGGFIIYWLENTKVTKLYAQRYTANNVRDGSEFQININPNVTSAYNFNIAQQNDGGFAIVYHQYSLSLDNLYIRRYTANGIPFGAELQITSTSTSPFAMAFVNDWNFVITYTDRRLANKLALYAQRYTFNGTKIGAEFQVNTNSEESAFGIIDHNILGFSDGGFVITSIRRSSDILYRVYARHYTSNGLAAGPEILIDTNDSSVQDPIPTKLATSAFVVTWLRYENNVNPKIFAQGFDATGLTMGAKFQVSTTRGTLPCIFNQNDDSFIITWLPDNDGIYARRYGVNTAPVLINNRLSIIEGQVVALNYTNIGAIDKENDPLTFTIPIVRQGYFELLSQPGFPITFFTQEQINKTQVRFVHDGTKLAPFYQVVVNDGQLTTLPSNAVIQFSKLEPSLAPTFTPSQTPSFTPRQTPESNQALIIGVSVGAASLAGVLGLAAIIGGACYYRHRKHHQRIPLEYRERLIDEDYQPKDDFNEPFSLIPFDEIITTKRLASGTFGTVFQGQWRHVDVAIKLLHMPTNLTEEQVDNFKKEATLMAKLHHPHVIHLYGICTEPEKYCLIMEYLPKGSLQSLLNSKETLSWSSRLLLALDIAKGMHYLHEEHIKHRDLKSNNVLLYKEDNQLRAKLCDFGLSIARNESSDSLVGTLGYIAPEIFESKPYTVKADVYSYGIILRELAAKAVLSREQQLAIPTDTPQFFRELIDRCSEVDPNNRPTMKEIVEILITHQENNEISLETTFASSLKEVGLFRHSSATGRRTLLNQQKNSSLNIEIPEIALDSQQDLSSNYFQLNK